MEKNYDYSAIQLRLPVTCDDDPVALVKRLQELLASDRKAMHVCLTPTDPPFLRGLLGEQSSLTVFLFEAEDDIRPGLTEDQLEPGKHYANVTTLADGLESKWLEIPNPNPVREGE